MLAFTLSIKCALSIGFFITSNGFMPSSTVVNSFVASKADKKLLLYLYLLLSASYIVEVHSWLAFLYLKLPSHSNCWSLPFLHRTAMLCKGQKILQHGQSLH